MIAVDVVIAVDAVVVDAVVVDAVVKTVGISDAGAVTDVAEVSIDEADTVNVETFAGGKTTNVDDVVG